MNRGIHFRCWTCAKTHDARALGTPEPKELDECCLRTLTDMADAFGKAMLFGVLRQIPKRAEEQARFQDKAADAMILSPDPEVRAAAIRWRNERAAKKSQG